MNINLCSLKLWEPILKWKLSCIVTETWLSDNVPSEDDNISGFILIREDRKTGLGGGCGIYVREVTSLKTCNDLSDPGFNVSG